MSAANPFDLETGTLVRTLSGRHIDVLRPRAEDFDIEDIAHGLAFECRFARQINEFYTVAQHSIKVALRLPPPLRLAGLLHDAPEFILGDLASPIKRRLVEYKRIEAGILEVLADKFGFTYPLDPLVKEIDNEILRQEYRDLVTGPRDRFFVVMSPPVAKADFLHLFRKLTDPTLPRV